MGGRVERFFRKQSRQLRRKASLPAAYLRSRRRARSERAVFADLRLFCLFVGYPRSGHSLVGALLDAHPDIAIAHELHVLRYARYGFGRDQLLALVLENSERAASSGREQTGYSYAVPGQWQGRIRRFLVAGDKRGGTTIRKLVRQPERLGQLERRLALPLRFVHVVRNPFDSIARMALASPHRSVEELTEHYFGMAAGVARLWQRTPPHERVDVRHEDLITHPQGELKRLCEFLGVVPEADYLEACAGVVWRTAQRTRDQLIWPPALRDSILRRVRRYPFFVGYDFER